MKSKGEQIAYGGYNGQFGYAPTHSILSVSARYEVDRLLANAMRNKTRTSRLILSKRELSEQIAAQGA